MTQLSEPVPLHLWTDGGDEVLIVRFCSATGESSRGFRYPLTVGAQVEAPDWVPEPKCGNGLHGWAWGLHVGDGMDPDWTATWLVIGVDPVDVVWLDGKVKFRSGTVRYVGTWYGATEFVLSGQIAWVQQNARGSASATGARGSASATGESGSASATGARGSASATGWSGSASATGASSAAVVTGTGGRVKAGPHGCICLAWWNQAQGRSEMRCARTGEGGLKPDVWYVLDDRGDFVEEVLG